MNENNPNPTSPSFAADPLNCDLSSIAPIRVLLRPDRMELVISKVEMTKSKSGGNMLKIEHKTVNPQYPMEGNEPVKAGHFVFNQLMTQVTGKATMEMVAGNVQELVLASRLTAAEAGYPIALATAEMWSPKLVGKRVFAQVDYEPSRTGDDGKTYEAGNKIGKYLKA